LSFYISGYELKQAPYKSEDESCVILQFGDPEGKVFDIRKGYNIITLSVIYINEIS
jgi:hypothetical protein